MVTATVFFGAPQQEIATALRHELATCRNARIVTGFATVDGIKSLVPSISGASPLSQLVVGAGTYKAFEALDHLIVSGIAQSCFRVHLGHTALKANGAKKNPFFRYHPLFHSKVYYFERADGTCSAYIGSHNATNFALNGLNGEASVKLEGPYSDPQFDAVRAHLDTAWQQAVDYDPNKKDELAWWSKSSFEGLVDKVDDAPRDGENRTTVILLVAEGSAGAALAIEQTVYFELPEAELVFEGGADVHFYLFPAMPPTPELALAALDRARAYKCVRVGWETKQGGMRLQAEWEVVRGPPAVLRQLPRKRVDRPRPAAGMEQVRVEVTRTLSRRYKYLFETSKAAWQPVLDEETTVQVSPEAGQILEALSLDPPEDIVYRRVRALVRADKPVTGDGELAKALRLSSPAAGAFVLISRKRYEFREKPEAKK